MDMDEPFHTRYSSNKIKQFLHFRSKSIVRLSFATSERGQLSISTVKFCIFSHQVLYFSIIRFCIDDLDFLNSLSKSPKPIDPIKVLT